MRRHRGGHGGRLACRGNGDCARAGRDRRRRHGRPTLRRDASDRRPPYDGRTADDEQERGRDRRFSPPQPEAGLRAERLAGGPTDRGNVDPRVALGVCTQEGAVTHHVDQARDPPSGAVYLA